EVQQYAMSQRGQVNLFDVLEAHVVPSVEQRSDLRREHQCLGAAWTGSAPNVLACLRRRVRAAGMRRQYEANRVVLHRRRDQYLANQLLPTANLLAVHDLLGFWPFIARRAVEDRHQLFSRGIVDEQLKKETIELGLRQGIRSFLFEWILRRHDEEWLLQMM